MADFACTCVVIGGGVIGLAVARELALAGHETYLLERESVTGSGTSSRNSEVIHAGIYYPKNSLKARFCVEGRGLLYDYCRTRNVPHRNCGKVIVATHESQLAQLKDIHTKAQANGVHDLRPLSQKETQALEPEVISVAGLFSPSTGIIDSHSYMEQLKSEFIQAGGHVVVRAPLEKWDVETRGIKLHIGGADPCTVTAQYVVNAAGLDAVPILKKLSGFPAAHIPSQHYAKGNYFILSGKSPFKHLVYPIPEAAGLGIHATLDMADQCRFGPDVEWVDDPTNLKVNPARAESFYKAIRSYWPTLPDNSLTTGYAGIRTKLRPQISPAIDDFLIQDEKTHGVRGLVNLLGIESPGLTSSLALAQHTRNLLFP